MVTKEEVNEMYPAPEQDIQELQPLPENGAQITEVVNTPALEVVTTMFGMNTEKFKKGIRELTKGELQKLLRTLCFEGIEPSEIGPAEIVLQPRLPELLSLAKGFVEAKFIAQLSLGLAAEDAANEELANKPHEGNDNGKDET